MGCRIKHKILGTMFQPTGRETLNWIVTTQNAKEFQTQDNHRTVTQSQPDRKCTNSVQPGRVHIFASWALFRLSFNLIYSGDILCHLCYFYNCSHFVDYYYHHHYQALIKIFI